VKYGGIDDVTSDVVRQWEYCFLLDCGIVRSRMCAFKVVLVRKGRGIDLISP